MAKLHLSNQTRFTNFEQALMACEAIFTHAACKGYLTHITADLDTRQCSCVIHLTRMPPFELPANYLYTDYEEDSHDYVSYYDGTIQHVTTITYFFLF